MVESRRENMEMGVEETNVEVEETIIDKQLSLLHLLIFSDLIE